MTINKFGSHIAIKHSKYKKRYFPFSLLKSEKDIDARNLRIINVANPIAAHDVANKVYCDTLAATYTDLKNWPGNYIDGKRKRLVNFAPPINRYDVVTKDFLNSTALTLVDGLYDSLGKRITNVGDPEKASDAVTLGYLKKILKDK